MKDNILRDLEGIGNPKLLYQIWEFINLIKKSSFKKEGNMAKVLSFAGCLSDDEATAIKNDIDTQFNKIEGDWD